MGERVSKGRTTIGKRSDRELVVTRTFDAPARMVWDAWAKPELFQQWWAPKSSGVPMLSCEMDVRPGGGYRIAFGQDAEHAMAFYGKYIEVTPPSRLVWTNDEGGEAGAVTTITFEETAGRTLLTLSELYPTAEAFDASFVGMEDGYPEQLDQLDELLASLVAGV